MRNIVETCQLITFLYSTSNYVLSQVLQDSGNIAGYVPDQLANDLSVMHLQNRYRGPWLGQEMNGAPYANAFTSPVSDEEPEEIKQNDDTKKRRKHKQHKSPKTLEEKIAEDTEEAETDTDAKKRFAVKGQKLNFDELVGKVKEQLVAEFSDITGGVKKEKYQRMKEELQSMSGRVVSKKDKSHNENKNTPREAWQQFMTPTAEIAAQDPHTYNVPKNVKTNANDKVYEGADLTGKKDSYEDYVTPKRGKIYASDTETETKQNQMDEQEKTSIYKDVGFQMSQYLNFKQKAPNTDKVKKVAAPLHYGRIKKLDDPIDFAVKDYDPQETKAPAEPVEKALMIQLGGDSEDDKPPKLKGTMIPKREYFKMSSPNYFAKLPAVAEKYDFNEPLPEKDREPEKLKYFFNPPAKINRKVPLSMSSNIEVL